MQQWKKYVHTREKKGKKKKEAGEEKMVKTKSKLETIIMKHPYFYLKILYTG